MTKKKEFAINVIITSLTALVIHLISIYFNMYISKKIGSEGVGLFNLIMSVYAFFITISSSGINLTATRLISEEIAKNNNKSSFKILAECICISFFMGFVASILLISISDFIVNTFLNNKIDNTPLLVISFSLPFISMNLAINGYFSATRKISKTSLIQIINEVLTIFLAYIFLNYIFPNDITYTCLALILSMTISEIISFSLMYISYIKEKHKQKYTEDSKSYLKNILRICVPVAITSYIRSGLNTLKHFLIPIQLEKSGLSAKNSLSKYGIINGMVMPILTLPCIFVNSVSALLIPEFSSIYVTKNNTKIQSLTKRILLISFSASLCIFGIYLSFGDDILILLYHEKEASFYFLALVPLSIIMYVDNIVDGILRGIDEQVNVMKCNILDLVISTLIIYFLVPVLSTKAYIISLYVSEFLNGSISIFLLIRKTKIKFNIKHMILIPLCISLISRYILYIICNLFFITNLIFKIAIYIMIFIFLTKNINKGYN